jgi:hypothetical protein
LPTCSVTTASTATVAAVAAANAKDDENTTPDDLVNVEGCARTRGMKV